MNDLTKQRKPCVFCNKIHLDYACDKEIDFIREELRLAKLENWQESKSTLSLHEYLGLNLNSTKSKSDKNLDN